MTAAADQDTRSDDALIIGGGIAGLVAANRLAQLGRTGRVLEKGDEARYLCNSRLSGGIIHLCHRDPMREAGDLAAAIATATGATAVPDLARAVATDTGRLIRWLQAEGVGFARGGAEEYKRWVLTPLRPQRAGLVWEGIGSDVMLRVLEKALAARGGAVVRGARVVAIEGAAPAFRVRTADGRAFAARAVVIADGGFQGNAALVERYISPRPDRLVQRGAGTGCGDGLTMAQALGAATVGLERFYGHALSAEALTNPKLWPYPWMDAIAAAGIVVNASAERFTDEGKGGVAIVRDIARLSDPLSSFAIFDEAIWQGPAAAGVIPANPHFKLAGAAIPCAGSIDALARLVGLPPALSSCVEAYNAALARNEGSALSPPRSDGKPAPIVKAPFYAMRLAAGITYTMGGIATDGHGRVLRADGTAIAGVYAAGATTGGLEGGPHAGYVGGLAKSGVMGLRAAEHIAGEITMTLDRCDPRS